MTRYGHDGREIVIPVFFCVVIGFSHSLVVADHAAAATFFFILVWSEVFIEFVIIIWGDNKPNIKPEISFDILKESFQLIESFVIFRLRIDVAVIEHDGHIEMRAKEKERPARARSAAAMKKKPWFPLAMEVFDLLKADVVIVRLLDVHP